MSAVDIERLLREALAPVDPPADLVPRLESTLVELTEMANEELEGWELSAMRDPRNWARPAAAAVVSASAGTALVLLRVSRKRRRQPVSLLDLPGQTLRDVAEEARRVLPER